MNHIPLFPPDPFPASRTRCGPGAQRTEPTSPLASVAEHGNVTPSPARRALQDAATPEHISLENHRHA